MELKDQIRIARNAAGMSTNDLAELLGVSKQAVIWWETGTHRPKMERIREIEAVLQVKFDVSERGNAMPLNSSENSPSVDPDSLRMAVAIGRLPKAFREAITTLIFFGERRAVIGQTSSFVTVEHASEAEGPPSFVQHVQQEEGVVHELPNFDAGKADAKPGGGKRAHKNAG